jgi:hypothetical protein
LLGWQIRRRRNNGGRKTISGRIWVQPLSRNTAQGASRIQDIHGATPIRGARACHVFFIFFFFVGFVAMI